MKEFQGFSDSLFLTFFFKKLIYSIQYFFVMTDLSNRFLQNGPITFQQVSDILEKVNDLYVGAFSVFLGRVRPDIIDNKRVSYIEYSAYPQMVVDVMDDILKKCYSMFKDIQCIEILHSTGIVNTGEISLMVIVGSIHRSESLKAVENIVETIKRSLPVWKKEFFEDGSYLWTQNQF